MTGLPDFLIFLIYYDVYANPLDRVDNQIINLLLTLFMLSIGQEANITYFFTKSVRKISSFRSPDQLKDFKTFFPVGTKSALARCMTKEIWE